MSILAIDIPSAAIEAFCLKWKIHELSLFGSVLRRDFGPESDIDIAIRLRSNNLLSSDPVVTPLCVDPVERCAVRCEAEAAQRDFSGPGISPEKSDSVGSRKTAPVKSCFATASRKL